MRATSQTLLVTLGILLFGLGSLSVEGVERIDIDSDRDPTYLPYFFTEQHSFKVGNDRPPLGRCLQLFQLSDESGAGPVIIFGKNSPPGSGEYASFLLKNIGNGETLSEDPIDMTITDYVVEREPGTGLVYAIGAGIMGDSSVVVRNIPGTDHFDLLFLLRGQDQSGDGKWSGSVQILAQSDYDLDGRLEMFVYTTAGRDIGPRRLACVELEPFRIEWTREVSSAIGRPAFYVCPDSLSPQVIFTSYGPQNGAIDETFDDQYGYFASLGRDGEVLFAHRTLENFGASALIPLDSGHQRFCFYHSQGITEDQLRETEESSGPWVSISNRDGVIDRSISVDEMIKSIWLMPYNGSDDLELCLLGVNGVISVFDQNLRLLAQSNATKLSSYLGQFLMAGEDEPVLVFGSKGGLAFYSTELEKLAVWDRPDALVQPLVVGAGGASRLVLSGSNHGSIVELKSRSSWILFISLFEEQQELVLTILIILTIGLVATNALRLQTLRRLRRREQMLSSLFDNMQDGFYRTDLEGKLTWASPSCARLLGSDDETFDPIGLNALDFYVHPEKRQALIEELKKSGRVTDWPVELRDVRGKIITVSTNSNFYYDENGKLAGIEGVFRDITQRREIERALRLSEEQYRSVVESAGEAIFSIERDGTYLFMNSVAAERLGGTAEKYVGRKITDLFPPEIAERHMKGILSVFDRGEGIVSDSKTTLKGEVREYNTSLQPVRNDVGVVVSVLGIARDITDHRLAEEKVRLQSDIMKNMSEGVYLVGVEDGIIRYCNHKFEELFGYEPGELVGKHASVVNSSAEDSPKETTKEIMAILQKEGEWHGEVYNVRKNGESFWCYASCSVHDYAEFGNVIVAVHTDVTERKETEARIRLLSSAVEQSSEGLAVATMDGKILFVNDALAEMHGFTSGELQGQHFSLLHPTDEIDLVVKAVEELQKTGLYIGELNHVRKDGTIFPALLNNSLLRDEAQNAVGMVATMTDITERKRVEEALRESEDKYRGIFDESVATVYIFDAEKNFIDSNLAGLELLGYSRTELLKMSIPDVDVAPASVQPAHKQLLDGDKLYNFEHQLRRKDGRVITVLNNSRPLTDAQGLVIGMQSTLIDISDRKRADETLRHRVDIESLVASVSTEFVSKSVDEVDQGIMAALRQVGEFMRADRGYVTRLQDDGQHMRISHFWPSESDPALIEKFATVRFDQMRWWMGKLKRFEYIALSQVQDIPLEAEMERELFANYDTKSILVVPLKLNGQLIGALQFSCLTTERDWPIEDIRMLNVIGEIIVNALEQKRKTEEVARVNRERLDQERQIAGGFAHEIRNALFPARGMLDKLVNSMAQEERSENNQIYSKMVDDSMTRAIDIVGSILKYTRLGNQRNEERVSLSETLNEVIKANQLELEEIRLIPKIVGDDQIKVWCNSQQLYMVLNNLVLNAIDAVKIHPDPKLDIEWVAQDGLVTVIVNDNGVGMTPEVQSRVFEAFYSTKPDRGTGLGLATVKKIMILYDGSVEVESVLGQGTVFRLTFKDAQIAR